MSTMNQISDLSHIVNSTTNPITLLLEWVSDAKTAGFSPHLLNLATSSRDGYVRNRTVVIRRFHPDGTLAFICQANSGKVLDIESNPQVSGTILMSYEKGSKQVTQQVRILGTAIKLLEDESVMYYNEEPVWGKIRALLGEDAVPPDWEQLKRRHDEYLEQIQNGVEFPKPANIIGFKIVPHEMEFYLSEAGTIADRLVFTNDGGQWTRQRLKA